MGIGRRHRGSSFWCMGTKRRLIHVRREHCLEWSTMRRRFCTSIATHHGLDGFFFSIWFFRWHFILNVGDGWVQEGYEWLCASWETWFSVRASHVHVGSILTFFILLWLPLQQITFCNTFKKSSRISSSCWTMKRLGMMSISMSIITHWWVSVHVHRVVVDHRCRVSYLQKFYRPIWLLRSTICATTSGIAWKPTAQWNTLHSFN